MLSSKWLVLSLTLAFLYNSPVGCLDSREAATNATNRPNLRRKTAASSSTPSERIRDVEDIDPGLLSGSSSANVTQPLGKQFNGGVGTFGPDPNFHSSGNSFLNGQPSGAFVPGQPNGAFLPGQGGFGIAPTNGIVPGPLGGGFPGGGLLPGATLPPGAVSPDTVAFSAVRASDFTRVGVTQVRLDFTLTDIGYGWYADRSEFVCYYPGLYFFTFSALSPQSRQFKLTLVRNNQEVISAWGDTNGYQMGSNSAILILNQGDRVYLVLQEGNLHETNNVGRGYTTFSGFRIR